MFKKLALKALAISALMTASANATLIEEELLVGGNGLVSINEIADDGLLTFDVELLASEVMVDSFAVSNNGEDWYPPSGQFFSAWSSLDDWMHTWVSSSMWNEGFQDIYDAGFNTADLGSFDEVFGDNANGAFVFVSTNSMFNIGGELDNNAVNSFNGNGVPWSEFVALNNGAVIDASNTNYISSAVSVSEPSTFAILLISLMGLVSRRFK